MLNSFKDRAGQYVKTIVDCNRCGLCDKSDGARMRFACGHSACVDCVAVFGDCPSCSPLVDSGPSRPRSDLPLTERVKRATELLTSFQDTYEVDVYQRQRISEQLKIEKELFPKCIQAPSKYFNKRKSLNLSSRNKENRNTSFSGGEVSSTRESSMNKSSYVQDWLNKHNVPSAPSRSPFADLQVNTRHNEGTFKSHTGKGKETLKALNQSTQAKNRKRSRLKQLPSNVQSNLENYLKPVEKSQNKNTWMSTKRLKQDLDAKTGKDKVQIKRNRDESGIVIDNDSLTIEDTQSQVIDKDRLALMAVANADIETSSSSIIEIEENQVNWGKDSTPIAYNDQKSKLNKVPFYRKSLLFKNCCQCIDNDIQNANKPKLLNDSLKNDNDISITVENKSFVTTITVVDCPENNFDTKQSTYVQTEEPFLGFKEETSLKEETAKIISRIQDYIESECMFPEEILPGTDSQRTTCTDVMAKHSAGNDLAESMAMVDNYTEYGLGILTECGAGLPNRKRKPPRGVTPDSTNSSDKENCDPNRKKKNDGKKKKKAN